MKEPKLVRNLRAGSKITEKISDLRFEESRSHCSLLNNQMIWYVGREKGSHLKYKQEDKRFEEKSLLKIIRSFEVLNPWV